MSVEAGSRALLADGDVVLVRPLHPADTAEVLALRTRLTEQDTYFRFFGARPSGLDRLAAVRELLLKVSRLAELVPELAELDLNPVRVRSDGCVALDVRARFEPDVSADPFLRRLRD
ncbi:acetate--CoA ligase family protein [Amycolatopsis sp. MtRt-6]|uniref:acetate--CoA ligase family protein n=1 Tax=Amycolatopsis sp. MtRt-6 TaxID=2792782 RepID=UPI001F5C4CB6|nr:acetate--CoA ligase family protein [Amycolatopsis sp. MtRt-6]